MKKYILLMVVIMLFCAGISFAKNQKTKLIQRVDKQIQTLQGAPPSSLQQQVSALREYTKRLNEKMNAISQMYNKQITQLQKQVADLQKRIIELESGTSASSANIMGFTKTSGNSYVFQANGAKIEIGPAGDIAIKGTIDVKIESNANMNISSGANMNIESAAVMNIDSSLLNLNGGGFPVARVSSRTVGAPPFAPDTIVDGSPTVFVP